MKTYMVNDLPDRIYLGKRSETGVHDVRIDCTAWRKLWPALSISIMVKPPDDEAAYPAQTHMEDDVIVWTVNSADTARVGRGSAEIVGIADGKKKLSATFVTYVNATITDVTGDPPEHVKPWLDDVLKTASDAYTSAEAAAGSATDARESAADAARSADAAGNSRVEAATYSASASESAARAAKYMGNASESAADAYLSAERSEQAAATHGYVFFEVNDEGHLIMTKTENVEGLDFQLNEGRLEVIYG